MPNVAFRFDGKEVERNGMSNAANAFLQKIPDLSFMLSSKISLPKK